MPFQANELVETERAVSAFMQRRRPPVEVRTEVDIDHRVDGPSLVVFERRRAWRGAPGGTLELPVAKATYVRSRDHGRVYWQRADYADTATTPPPRSRPCRHSSTSSTRTRTPASSVEGRSVPRRCAPSIEVRVRRCARSRVPAAEWAGIDRDVAPSAQ